jgi:hypothetical protein
MLFDNRNKKKKPKNPQIFQSEEGRKKQRMPIILSTKQAEIRRI